MTAPKARKLLERRVPEEFGEAASSPEGVQDLPHQDRYPAVFLVSV